MSRILLHGGQVVSMAPERPDHERADVLIDGNRIAEIGPQLKALGAEIVNVAGRVIIPGLVNAHLHTWQTAMRFIGTDWALPEYLAMVHGELARHYRPMDIHIGTVAGALNQIDAGVTTLGDWSHNCLSAEHADAGLEALARAGIRAVFLHGNPHGLRDRPHNISEIDRLLGGPLVSGELVSLGMAIKGPQLSKPEVAVADLRAAAERGLVASMHQSVGTPSPGWQAVSAAGLWGPLTNIVHGTGLPREFLAELAHTGVTFTATPENELGQGHVTRMAEHLLADGAAPSLGTDTEVAASAEVLTAARVLLAVQRDIRHRAAWHSTGLGMSTVPLTAKQALSWATVAGARALGLSDRIGHLASGMQADLTVIDARRLNLWPLHDPVAAALNATTANIEAVMIAGQWRKRDYALLCPDLDVIHDDLCRSGEQLSRRLRAPGTLGTLRLRVTRQVVNHQLSAQTRLGQP